MVGERSAIRDYVSRVMEGRPVLWADERVSKGDFDGRDWTLEIFDVPHHEQRAWHARLWTLHRRVWQQMHQSLTLVFHTPEETTRLYPWVRQKRPSILLDSARPDAFARLSVEQLTATEGVTPDHRRRLPVPPPRRAA